MRSESEWDTGGITDDFFDNLIGMYGDMTSQPNRYIFFNRFVSIDGAIDEGVEVSILYQMGDENSDWEGVYITGVAGGFDYARKLSPRGFPNSGWDPATPAYPTTESSFEGFF